MIWPILLGFFQDSFSERERERNGKKHIFEVLIIHWTCPVRMWCRRMTQASAPFLPGDVTDPHVSAAGSPVPSSKWNMFGVSSFSFLSFFSFICCVVVSSFFFRLAVILDFSSMNSIFPLGDDLACRRNFALYLFLGSVGGSAIFSLPLPPMFWFFFLALSLSLSLFFSLFFLFFFIFLKLTWQRCFLIRLISRDSGHRVASARSLLEKLHPGGPSPAASVQLCHRTFKSCWRRRALHRRVPVIGRSSTKSSAGLVSLPTREASLQGSVSRAPVSRLTSINSWPNLNFF